MLLVEGIELGWISLVGMRYRGIGPYVEDVPIPARRDNAFILHPKCD